MENSRKNCPVCCAFATVESLYNYTSNFDQHFYVCEICGRFASDDNYLNSINNDILASFLYYNCTLFPPSKNNKFFFYLGTEKVFELIHKDHPYCHLIKIEEIEAWYPRNFSEKIDKILLGLAELSIFIGYEIKIKHEQLNSIFFIKQKTCDGNLNFNECLEQAKFIVDYLVAQNMIKASTLLGLTILPDGWKRIDELQKNHSNNKQAFVAMRFSDETKELREALREGIQKAGFIACFIDEKHHNEQIVPEILFQIRQSKFVVAEFSDNNNGAYYEAGYATGLGKEVIHICNEDKFNEAGHFDIKQKSTVLWKTIEEIPHALHKHIEATIC